LPVPETELDVNCPELAYTNVPDGILTVTLAAVDRRPSGPTVITGICEDPPYVPDATPVLVRLLMNVPFAANTTVLPTVRPFLTTKFAWTDAGAVI
jgi:hypothetical protein